MSCKIYVGLGKSAKEYPLRLFLWMSLIAIAYKLRDRGGVYINNSILLKIVHFVQASQCFFNGCVVIILEAVFESLTPTQPLGAPSA